MAHQLVQFNHVYTDYEFVGNIQDGAEACEIWHIGAIKPDNSTFEVFINNGVDVVNNSFGYTGTIEEYTEEQLFGQMLLKMAY